MSFVRLAGGMRSSAFDSYRTAPVSASMRITDRAFRAGGPAGPAFAPERNGSAAYADRAAAASSKMQNSDAGRVRSMCIGTAAEGLGASRL